MCYCNRKRHELYQHHQTLPSLIQGPCKSIYSNHLFKIAKVSRVSFNSKPTQWTNSYLSASGFVSQRTQSQIRFWEHLSDIKATHLTENEIILPVPLFTLNPSFISSIKNYSQCFGFKKIKNTLLCEENPHTRSLMCSSSMFKRYTLSIRNSHYFPTKQSHAIVNFLLITDCHWFKWRKWSSCDTVGLLKRNLF